MKLSDFFKDLTGKYFVFSLIFFSILAYSFPKYFVFINPYIGTLLGVVMLCMGMTLKLDDFKTVLFKPFPAVLGVVAQFTIMPLLGFTVAKLMNFSAEIASGFVLLGCCPSGTASTVLVYLSRGNVVLSVVMTSIATLLAPFLTPFLMYVLAGEWVHVDPVSMFVYIVQIIIIPIAVGLAINKYFSGIAKGTKDFTPAISSVAIILIVTGIVALNTSHISRCGTNIFSSIVVYNFFGFLLGYLVASLLKQPEVNKKAISIEVGIQNAGLGASLAYTYFTSLTALPSVMYAIWALITGSLLASYWSRIKK